MFILVKRHRERPRRPLRVWLYDASKQAIAQAVIHFLSILLAMGLGVRERHGVQDMCVWYFLNIMLDTTIGVLLLAGFHAIVRAIAKRKQIKSLESGNYGKPPRLSIWAIQLVVFIFNIALVKVRQGRFLLQSCILTRRAAHNWVNSVAFPENRPLDVGPL